MTAPPVRADELQCADRIGGGPAQHLFIDPRRRCCPVANDRRFTLAPGRSTHLGEPGPDIVVHFREEPAPALVDGARVFEKTGVEFGYEPGVGAGQKRRAVNISHAVTGMVGGTQSNTHRRNLPLSAAGGGEGGARAEGVGGGGGPRQLGCDGTTPLTLPSPPQAGGEGELYKYAIGWP